MKLRTANDKIKCIKCHKEIKRPAGVYFKGGNALCWWCYMQVEKRVN
uniref:Uncharacterized protein n=1 Tax=viral metagenome TaxID=1070528 RepID=A0A6M3LQA6_9ZZZZ